MSGLDRLDAGEDTSAAVLALSHVTLPAAQATRTTGAFCGGLTSDVHLWLGGSGARRVALPEGGENIEQRVILLGVASAPQVFHD